jgi:hypothetical protein
MYFLVIRISPYIPDGKMDSEGGKFWVFLFCKLHLWLGEVRFLGNLITGQWSGFSTMLIGEPVCQGGIGFRFISTGDNYYKTV